MKSLISFTVIALILLSSCGSNNTNTPVKTQSNIEKWYEGGTLHKAKISDWKAATEKNKLATSADFMAKVDNSVSMDVLKQRATSLMNCIDESTRGLDSTNNESVSSVAVKCILLLGYKL